MGMGNITEITLNGSGDRIETGDRLSGYVSRLSFQLERSMSQQVSCLNFHSDNDTNLMGTDITKGTQSARVNLMYLAAQKVTVGDEIPHANCEVEDGNDAALTRVQLWCSTILMAVQF